MRILGAVTVLAVVVSLGGGVVGQDGSPADSFLLESPFGQVPVHFIENRGVYPDEVAYYVPGADKTLFFTKEGITFHLRGKHRGWVVKQDFVDADSDVVPRGEDRRQAVFSYFRPLLPNNSLVSVNRATCQF